MTAPLLNWILRHRARLDRLLLWGGIVLATAAAVAGLASGERRFLTFYTAPLLLAGPLWLRLRLRRIEALPRAVVVLDLGVFALGAVRGAVGWPFPFSGHVLFLTYALAVTPERGFRAAAALLLLATTVFKLWLWRDPLTWGWGLALGLAAALLHVGLMHRSQRA